MQKEGVGTGIDTLRANVELQNEKQRLIEAEAQRETNIFGLSRLLNLDPRQKIELADSLSFFETPQPELEAEHRGRTCRAAGMEIAGGANQGGELRQESVERIAAAFGEISTAMGRNSGVFADAVIPTYNVRSAASRCRCLPAAGFTRRSCERTWRFSESSSNKQICETRSRWR